MMEMPIVFVEKIQCTVKNVLGNTMTVVPIKIQKYKLDYSIPVTNQYGDFANFYSGQKVICIMYRYSLIKKSLYDYYDIGVVDENIYNNAVRDSQRIPKNWLHLPTLNNTVEYGTIVQKDKDYIYFVADKTIEMKQLSIKETIVDFEGLKVGSRVAVASFSYITSTDTEIKNVIIYKAQVYKDYIESFVEEMKQETNQFRV